MLRTCTSCNRTFDTEDYMNDDMSEESNLCPDCYYSGDCLDPENEEPDDDLELYEDESESDEDVPEGFFEGVEADDEEYSEEDFEDFCEDLEGDYEV